MKRYDERILGELLDKYERSLLYEGKNQRSMSISVKILKKTFPEYFDESAMQYLTIHEQLMQMENQGYIRLVWKGKKPGHILDRCELVVENSEQVYRFLNRKPKNAKQQEIFRISEMYLGKEETLDSFLKWLHTRMNNNDTVLKYVDYEKPENFRTLCEIILQILRNETECFLRQFSVRYFHDSKLVEKEISKAARIISEFSRDERLRELEAEEVLQEYSIYRNPSWIMMKGNSLFLQGNGFEKSKVDLVDFPNGIGIPNQDIETVVWDRERTVARILTIENLTSFHQWKVQSDTKTLCIYLGGYHNRPKRTFLQKIYEAYPEAEYFHFGDIDCGGFRIWKDLCLKTGILFRTMEMDLTTYCRYKRWGRPLTSTDRRMLLSMMEDPFFVAQKELFEYMMKDGVKIEQECIGDLSELFCK